MLNASVEKQQLSWKLGFRRIGRRIEHAFSDLNDLLNSLNSCKTRECAFHHCPKQGLKMEAVVLHWVGFFAFFFCPKQGQDFNSHIPPSPPHYSPHPSLPLIPHPSTLTSHPSTLTTCFHSNKFVRFRSLCFFIHLEIFCVLDGWPWASHKRNKPDARHVLFCTDSKPQRFPSSS